jgi:hypothetical protein
LLAYPQGDLSDLTRRRVGLIEHARRIWIDLISVDEATAIRLHAGGGIGAIDAHLWVGDCSGPFPVVSGFNWQRLRQLDYLDERRRIDLERRGLSGFTEGFNPSILAPLKNGET